MNTPRFWQIPLGGIFLLLGLPIFFYFGSRERPSIEEATEAMRREAMFLDAATVAGLIFLFLGLLFCLLGLAKKWNHAP